MKSRMATNNLRDENIKLRTRLHIIENELSRKDKIIDELLQVQQDVANFGNSNKLIRPKTDAHHLVVNLKRKVREQQVELTTKRDEVELLKRNIKNTRTHETEIEIKMYMDECLRLRQSLENVIKSKDTFADP
jgi:neutral trehalase